MRSKLKHKNNCNILWRREKIQELSSQGYSQREIASVMRVGVATVNRDIAYLREQSKNNIRKYVDEKLPEEYEKCLVGLTAILKEAWNAAKGSEDKREKIQALSLAKDCYSMKLELLTNATVVDDAIRFVSAYKNESEIKSNDSDILTELDTQKSLPSENN